MAVLALVAPFRTSAATFLVSSGNNGTAFNVADTGDILADSGGTNANYVINQNYTNTLVAPIGQAVQLTFVGFRAAAGDSLTIYDGPNTTFPVLATLTGTSLPSPVSCTGNIMTIKWVSDAASVDTGFWANITAVSPSSCDFRIAVANYGANTITIYKSDGTYVGTAASAGSLKNPNYILPRANGNYLLGNGASTVNGGNNVVEYNFYTGALVGEFITAATGNLNFPEQMRIGPDGLIYVVSQNGVTVKRFNASTGALIETAFMTSAVGLANPLGLVFDNAGNIYVSNNGSGGAIRKYDSSGAFVSVLWTAPVNDSPRGLTLSPDGLYIYAIVDNSAGFYVQKILVASPNTATNFLTGTGGTFSPYNGIDWGPDGNLYVSDYGANTLRVYNSSGAVVRTITANLNGPHHAVFLPCLLSDFGDLPVGYPTTLRDNGPRHIVTSLKLGAAIDVDADGQPLDSAQGDDQDADGDDEDGVTFPALFAGQTATVVVNASAAGKLNAFFDWNGDKDFLDAGETITEISVVAGNNNLSVPVPAGVAAGPLGARFRLSTAGGLTSVGAAQDGEVEDYIVSVGYDYGDLSITGTTFNTDGGGMAASAPRHQVGVLRLGINLDSEANGAPSTNADGDDLAGKPPDDEDGVTIPALTAGQDATFVITSTGGAGLLNAWVDWNNNGTFDAGSEVIATNLSFTTSTNLVVRVPADATTATALAARFRLSTAGNDGPTNGTATDGEIEDYKTPTVAVGYDYGDLSITGTTFNTAGAGTPANAPRHQVGALRLGTNVDSEANGVPSANADGDDTALTPDDEDGVIFPASIAQGQSLLLPVIVTGGSGILNAWIDWDNSGTWAAGSEVIATNVSVVAGTNYLTVTVPATATIASLAARFRLTASGNVGCTNGTATTGEIEDYKISVVAACRLGNKVWLDDGAGGGTPNNGLMDAAGTESIGGGINGVGVHVYAADASGDPTGFPLSSMTTVASGTTNGFYGFNLPPGDYVVVIPATNFASGAALFGLYSSGTSTGTFNGIDPDTTPTDKDDNGFNAINPAGTGVRSAAVTLSVGGEPTGEVDRTATDIAFTDNSANLTVDFGFVSTAPTAVKLGYVKGWWAGSQVTVEWETVTELDTLGFDLYRLQDGDRIRVNADLVPALNIERGGIYRVTEAMAKPSRPLSYLLVEQETNGRQNGYGPFTVTVQTSASSSSVDVKGGSLEFRFNGEPGATYQIESTEDMVHGRWTTVGSATADADGVLLFRRTIGGSEPVRFYRALRP